MTDSNRRLQTAETRKKIIRSVQMLLSAMDANEIKIRDICKKAGVSIGTFYLYFSCKEDAILYIYRECDRYFEDLAMTNDIKSNILSILKTYFGMIHLGDMPFNRYLCICHLTYYDSYFFDENRFLFQQLNRQLFSLAKGADTTAITSDILDYVRGLVYNLCIHFETATTGWLNRQVEQTWQYIQFLLSLQDKI